MAKKLKKQAKQQSKNLAVRRLSKRKPGPKSNQQKAAEHRKKLTVNLADAKVDPKSLPVPPTKQKPSGKNPNIAPEKHPAKWRPEQIAAAKEGVKTLLKIGGWKMETGLASGIQLDQSRQAFVPVKEIDGAMHYLTIEGGQIDVVAVKPDDPRRRRWINYEGGSSRADAAVMYKNSFLQKTPAAARAIGYLTGDGDYPGEAPKKSEDGTLPKEGRKRTVSTLGGSGYSLAQICQELKLDAVEVRKTLRAEKVQKPGARWEWPTKEAAKDVIALLSKGAK